MEKMDKNFGEAKSMSLIAKEDKKKIYRIFSLSLENNNGSANESWKEYLNSANVMLKHKRISVQQCLWLNKIFDEWKKFIPRCAKNKTNSFLDEKNFSTSEIQLLLNVLNYHIQLRTEKNSNVFNIKKSKNLKCTRRSALSHYESLPSCYFN